MAYLGLPGGQKGPFLDPFLGPFWDPFLAPFGPYTELGLWLRGQYLQIGVPNMAQKGTQKWPFWAILGHFWAIFGPYLGPLFGGIGHIAIGPVRCLGQKGPKRVPKRDPKRDPNMASWALPQEGRNHRFKRFPTGASLNLARVAKKGHFWPFLGHIWAIFGPYLGPLFGGTGHIAIGPVRCLGQKGPKRAQKGCQNGPK